MQKLTISTFLVISFIVLSCHSFAQQSYSGKIIDEFNRPISSVHIWVDQSTNGTITNKKGVFNIKIQAFPVTIHISHLSFIGQELTLKSAEALKKTIILKSLVLTLPTASITSEKLVDLTKNYLYDISDFEIYQDHLLLLAYQWKQKTNPWLIMLNAYGDTLWTSYIGKDGELYKDCMGHIHLVTKKAAYQIFIEEDNFQLYPAVSIKEFEELLKPCIESHDDKIYMEQYVYADQILNYFEANLKDTSVQQIATIADEQAMRWLADDANGFSPPRNEHDQRFEQLFFYDKVYAPLIKKGDSTIIFDFVNDEIGLFDINFELLSTTKIDFHHTLKWKEKLFVDEKTETVYTMFRRGGFHYLNAIELETGDLSADISIPKFTFIGKLRVHDHKIYFLYRDRMNGESLTKIYLMKI